jgi:hypothetical protein
MRKMQDSFLLKYPYFRIDFYAPPLMRRTTARSTLSTRHSCGGSCVITPCGAAEECPQASGAILRMAPSYFTLFPWGRTTFLFIFINQLFYKVDYCSNDTTYGTKQ